MHHGSWVQSVTWGEWGLQTSSHYSRHRAQVSTQNMGSLATRSPPGRELRRAILWGISASLQAHSCFQTCSPWGDFTREVAAPSCEFCMKVHTCTSRGGKFTCSAVQPRASRQAQQQAQAHRDAFQDSSESGSVNASRPCDHGLKASNTWLM